MPERTESATFESPRVIYPSPVFIVGPLLIAVGLISGGIANGHIANEHSTPALVLLCLTYLISRWYRRAHLVFDATKVALQERYVMYCDVGNVRLERGEKRPVMMLNFYDKNRVIRLRIPIRLYGSGVSKIGEILRAELPEAISAELKLGAGHRIFLLWIVVGITTCLAALESFNVFG